MKSVRSVAGLRKIVHSWRARGLSVALVPTMGALHEGHMTLVRAAQKKADRVVVSVFVNPTQFAPGEDFDKYPRTLAADKKLLEANGADLLYVPAVSEMYAPEATTVVHPGPLAGILEGAVRPTHFAGVALVVTKLLMQVQPDHAFFGEKDYQQLIVLRRVATDLDLPVAIHGVPICRAADGLALSSRNAYLTAKERAAAPALAATLKETATLLAAGKGTAALTRAKARLVKAGFDVDYLAWRDADTLQPLTRASRRGRLLVAARLGQTRLIDNVPVRRKK